MARVFVLSEPTQLLTHAYVVDRAVGYGCPNDRNDVLLVQFFLRSLMAPRGSYGRQELFQPAGEQPLSIDGVCAKHTVTYIKSFQQQFNAIEAGIVAGGPLALREDGAIHPLEGGSLFGKRFHHLMTLVRLNTEYSDMFSLPQHQHIDRSPLFPRELFASLFL